MLQNQAPPMEKILQLEASMREMTQVSVPRAHDFCKGMYARTIYLKAGTQLIGHYHKSENFYVVRSGSIKIWTGYEAIVVHAGHMGVSPVGVKRVGVALTDVIFTTFHPNPDNVTNEEDLWELYVTDDPSQITYEIEVTKEIEK
jgi:mannose-6-phosphate isomerase-like protein (cupin superfamily)